MTTEPMCTANMLDSMSRGLGSTQRAILAELAKLPIEVAPPRTIPVTVLATRLGCSDRQIRRAVYALKARGLVALTKEPRPGRQGLSLMVWEARSYEAWMNFIDPARIAARRMARIRQAVGEDAWHKYHHLVLAQVPAHRRV